MPTHPIPINDAEAVFERLWGASQVVVDRWRFECDAGTRGSFNPFWMGAMFRWERGEHMTVGRITRSMNIDITGYDHLHLCINLPASAHLSVRGVIGGRPALLINDAPGQNKFVEYEGALPPHAQGCLDQIELQIRDDAAGGTARLLWIGLFHKGRRDTLRNRPSPYEHAWDNMLLPPDQTPEPAPTLGLFFDKNDLESLRNKARSPQYAPLMGSLRQVARACLDLEPWRGVARHLNGDGEARCGRGAGLDGPISLLAMRLGAFVGLLDNDPDLLRMALHHALAAAHCEYWASSFMEVCPGTAFEQRAFFEYRIGTNLVFAWDWAGSYLTPAGRELLAHAIATKAVGQIQHTLMKHPYVRGCNQGAYMAYGAIVCLSALARIWPLTKAWIDPAVQALDETMNTYISPDGGAFEGLGYVTSTLGHALVAYQLLARQRGVALHEIVPPRVVRSVDYLATMLSTAPPVGGGINVADGGRPGSTLYPECLAGLCQLTDAPEMPALLAAMLAAPQGQESGAVPGSVFNLIFGPAPESLPDMRAERGGGGGARPAVFKILPHTGQLCSCRPTAAGAVRLQLIGAPAGAGHAHEDKGSFVIEAYGEEIAIERGQMAYDDPRCTVIGAARYHNLLVPVNADGTPAHQANPCPAAVLPTGEGDLQRLRAHVDAGAAWAPHAQRWVRSIESDRPESFLMVDEMDMHSPMAVVFLVHSRFPWTWDGSRHSWVTCGSQAELSVTPEWTPMHASGGEDFVDGSKKPVFTLALKTQPGVVHRLRTSLEVSPAKSRAEPLATTA